MAGDSLKVCTRLFGAISQVNPMKEMNKKAAAH